RSLGKHPVWGALLRLGTGDGRAQKMGPRGRVALAALCGAVTLVWGATGHFGSPRVEDTPASIASSPAESTAASAVAGPVPVPQAVAQDAPPVVAMEDTPPAATSEHARQPPPSEEPLAAADPAIVEPAPVAPVPTPGMQLASLGPSEPAQSYAKAETPPRETREECSAPRDICVDLYLFEVYERTPKQDTVKVSEKVKATVTKKGKTRTITKTVVKLVDEDFGWKDPKAAQRVGMPLNEYVICGRDRSVNGKLYLALRAMDEAGLERVITSGFRDDYRQAIASGKKAASDSSYHGGSRRGGYGHGLAADLVSVKGATRAERWVSTEALWKWVDAHGAEY